MTIVEALVAITILIGMVSGALETCRLAIMRSALATMELQLVSEAESMMLQSSVGRIEVGAQSGVTSSGFRWTKTITPVGANRNLPATYQIVVEARSDRGGLSISKKLAGIRIVGSGS